MALNGSPSRTVLVTGGSGFIGSHVVDRLRAAGWSPRIYDVRPSSYHTPDEAPQVVGDLCDLERLEEAMEGCAAVIHLAAAADVNEVQAEPVESEERNARGTLHVLEAARRREVPRVVYASTIWVYSDTPAELHTECLALHAPAHLYTATKLAGEHYCHSYSELYGLTSTILRFGIPYGPRARPAAVIPAFVNKALAGQALTIAGDGSQSRRFVYVEDLAEGVVRALAPVAAGRTYNLVGTEDVSIREIAETVRDIVGDVPVEFTPGRAGDFAGAPVCGQAAARDLDWRASTPFREGVRQYVDWHREAAVAAPSRVPRRLRVGALARRGALALGMAALAAVLVLGVLTLAPVDADAGPYNTFIAAVLVLLPLALAGGFEWGAASGRGLRAVLWTAVVCCLAVAILPWPGVAHRIGHGHAVILVLFALAAGTAARLSSRPVSLSWLAADD